MNLLVPARPPECTPCRCVDDPGAIRARLAVNMRDESRMAHGWATAAYFPGTTSEVSWAVQDAARRGLRALVSGGRTGIAGGATVTEPCALICTERLTGKPVLVNTADGAWQVQVPAGVTLADLATALATGGCGGDQPSRELLYPVDPTELTAQVGGSIATNASGARTFHYGPTRAWVDALTVVLADGRVLALQRGEVLAEGRRFLLRGADGRDLPVVLPAVDPPGVKATLGYHAADRMDAVDLFIGSEGTLGIITEARLKLVARPTVLLCVCQYLDSEARALDYVHALLDGSSGLRPLAVEYFDPHGIALLRERRAGEGGSSPVPDLPPEARAVIYTEHALDDEAHLDARLDALVRMATQVGANPARSWAGHRRQDLQRMKLFRHALPETVNSLIGQRKLAIPQLHKVGTDMAVPLARLRDIMAVYRDSLTEAGLQYVVFGHIGNAHVHVNILPRSAEELAAAKKRYRVFAAEAVRMGGSVSAEHGIGRLKKDFLALQYPPDVLNAMRTLRKVFDPAGLLNPGVLLDPA